METGQVCVAWGGHKVTLAQMINYCERADYFCFVLGMVMNQSNILFISLIIQDL